MKNSEIIELASRYIDSDDFADFPAEGDVFAFFHRELPDNKVLKDDEGWQFGGYATLDSYELDIDAKPVGKWIDIYFTSLAMYPPQSASMRLQPPHIALARFQDPSRTLETKMVPIDRKNKISGVNEPSKGEPKIVKFPGKR